MRKKKILIHTNAPWVRTGLAENGRALASYLHKTGKYEVIYYCSQTSSADPTLAAMPWKSYGSVPADPNIHQQMNQNPHLARSISYGSYFIDEIIKTEKPDIYWGSDDIWFEDGYTNRKWWNKLNPVLHITVDSIPVLDQAFQQAKKTKSYFTWAKFAEKEMKRLGQEFSHISSIYGAVNLKDFEPINLETKNKLRERFGIDKNTIIIGMVGRNQLRKEKPAMLLALAEFKKENPNANIKIHFHTSFSEKGGGWDIEKLTSYYGIKKENVLCTYVCKNCGNWHVAPYGGEDINCPYCGAEKSMITANIANGVPNEEMKFLYGIWDAGVNVHTSGGLEFNCVNTLLCGLPLACTNYASGEDFCEQSFVTPINFERRFEAGTSFMKAANSIKSIKGFYEKIYKMSYQDRLKIGLKGVEWAQKTFAIEEIGKQWEAVFDALPEVNWEGFSFENEEKNPGYQLPTNYKEIPEDDFLQLLYKEILKGIGDEQGMANWRTQLKNGISREQIYQFFVKIAFEDNQKSKKTDIWDLIDKHRENYRLALIIKESIGDCFMILSLLESLHEQYPNTDVYVITESKYFEIFEQSEYVHKVIPYFPAAEQEMAMIGCGTDNALFDYYLHPAILTQRHLGYLGNPNALRIRK